MTTDVPLKRFVLRRESFGGLLCESRRRRYFRFDEQVFDTLKTRAAAGPEAQTDVVPEGYRAFIAHCKNVGAIEAESELFDVRVVEHPLPTLPTTDLASPLRVYDYVGYGCNLSCSRCLNDSTIAKAEVNRRSLEQSVGIMQKFYDAGTTEWQFTGGEPTFYKEFDEWVRIASKQFGFYILLNTNGVWGDERRPHILASGINEVMLSLDGGPSINNLLRGPNTYQQIIPTITAIAEWNQTHDEAERILLTLNMTYGRQNMGEIEHIIELGAKYGANVSLLPERPYGRSIPSSMLTSEENLAFYRTIAEIRKRDHIVASGIKISGIMDLFNQNFIPNANQQYDFFIDYTTCGPNSNSISLLPDGDANICGFFYDKALPLHQQFRGANMMREDVSAYDAWYDPKIREMKDATRDMCDTCEFYGKQCLGKCAAIVLADGGSLVDGVLHGQDRYCYAQMILKEEAKKSTTIPLGNVGR